MSDPWAAFGSESTPTPEPTTPAPSAPAEAEAPAPSSVETPTTPAETPTDAPRAPADAAPPTPQYTPPAAVPPDPEFVQAAEQLQAHRGTLTNEWQKMAAQEATDYEATLRLQGRLDAEAFEQEKAAYLQRRAQREMHVSKLQSGWDRLNALDHELGVEWQRRQERASLQPFAAAVTPLLAAQKYAAQWKDPTTPFPAQEFMRRIADASAGAFEEVAPREFAALQREAALKRQLAGIDHMGGAGGGAGGGLDYAKMSTSELARKGAESFFAKK